MNERILALHIETESGGVLGIFLDTLLDALKMLPFLFAAFCLIELLEHRAGEKLSRFFARSGKAGPLVGAVLGCVPQCGFSVLSANLYAGGVITLGTLCAVFLSTSDEAVLLLAATPSAAPDILKLLLVKVCIGIAAGYLVDFLFRKKTDSDLQLKDLCDHEHCGCHEHGGVLRPALLHTAKIFGFVFLITLVLNFLVEFLGHERLEALLLHDSVFQPFLTALFGFIPNCAASVLLTQLYLEGALQFGAVVSGLCTGAGAGLLVLFRENRNPKDNLKILGILYVAAVVPGVILQILGI
ncbi:MAG: putative manganese transporter [Candidatus Fimenecus sp.]